MPASPRELTASTPLDGTTAPSREPMLHDLLIFGPDVGQDSDFERGHSLAKEIKAMTEEDSLDEILKLSPTLRKAFEDGVKSARLELLSEVFAEQAGRAPTPEEEVALARRTQEIGALQIARALFDLRGDALIAWLLGNGPVPERDGDA